ncbi:hypothetical protein [Sphingobacterium pedocola]|uniref:Uncharacterized protein n=1 Tax=Sphingobacterium pedocola TaxID=2082722 RepID=A0ABR9T3C4_9SPHI|nr:hypothetical protein [Sphingobacterium pedocola]MBE8719539.1 hypothetical protein [Sphingobacterium pedocola]
MTLEEFKETLTHPLPPENSSVQIKALWHDAKGDWKVAHDLIDHLEDSTSAHVHAYLHRVEGDLWNARYWYKKAGQPEFNGTLVEEWEHLFALLNQ